MIEVSLLAATICFGGGCYPILAGRHTPVGEFTLEHKHISQPGYGGDILLFHDDGRGWYAIHRTWRGRGHLYAEDPQRRRNVSLGCINVEPAVYQRLLDYSRGLGPARLHVSRS
jgi:hypothetical protein